MSKLYALATNGAYRFPIEVGEIEDDGATFSATVDCPQLKKKHVCIYGEREKLLHKPSYGLKSKHTRKRNFRKK